MTDLEAIGGEEGVERVVRSFLRRASTDPIIGFQFEGKDLERIVLRETELAAEHLGGVPRYGGRALGEVHAPLRIHRGQFRRRLHLLEKTLREAGVPDAIVARWLAHDAALEDVVSSPDDCAPR